MNLHSEEVALCTCVAAGEGFSLQNLSLREVLVRIWECHRLHRPRHHTCHPRTIRGEGFFRRGFQVIRRVQLRGLRNKELPELYGRR